MRAAQFGPQAPERRAGGVQDVAAFADGVQDVLGQAGMITEIYLGELEQRGHSPAGWPDRSASRRVPEWNRRGSVEQLFRSEDAANPGALGQWPHVVHAAQVQAGAQAGQLQRFAGRGEATPGRIDFTGQQQRRQRELATRREARMARQLLTNGIELKRPNRESGLRRVCSGGVHTGLSLT